MKVIPFAMCLPFAPLTIIHVSIRMNYPPSAMMLVFKPFTLIYGPVKPYHDSEPLSHLASRYIIKSLDLILIIISPFILVER